jgi:dTDP-4-dehydrorhamnose reductase
MSQQRIIKLLLFGDTGKIGNEIKIATPKTWQLACFSRKEIDFRNTRDIRNIIKSTSPNIIINAAAYTNIDDAENSSQLAMKINSEAVRVIAEEAERINCSLIHYSTDYVFDGLKNTPYIETDIPNPINVYGASKLQGENYVLSIGGASIVLRTSWIFCKRGENFLTKLLRLTREKEMIYVVQDQIGCPTWSRDIAVATIELIKMSEREIYDFFKSKHGIYHCCSKGSISRYGWAKEILRLDPQKDNKKTQELIATTSEEFAGVARRPRYSVLSSELFEKTFMIQVPMWKDSLKKMMDTVALEY